MNLGIPPDLTWYRLLTDFGSFIGGLFALAAGVIAFFAGKIAAKATRQAVAMQIADTNRKERLEARSIAVAIYPELRELKNTIDNTIENLTEDKEKRAKFPGQAIAAGLQLTAHLSLPPMLERNIDKLYLLGDPSGFTVLQLVQDILEFNVFIESAAAQIAVLGAFEWLHFSIRGWSASIC